eukprot:scaffold43030_cov23-Tisochrysis_lutea.AAC.2
MARRGGGEPPVNKPHELAAPAEPGRGRMRVRRILLSVCLCVLALLIMIKVAPPKEGEFDVHILFRRLQKSAANGRAASIEERLSSDEEFGVTGSSEEDRKRNGSDEERCGERYDGKRCDES